MSEDIHHNCGGWHGQVEDLAVAKPRGDTTAKLHFVPLDRATRLIKLDVTSQAE